MGQNYSALPDRNVGSAGIEITELSDIHYERSLGSARFLKTIRASHDDGLVVVKIFLKPSPTFSLEEYHSQIKRACPMHSSSPPLELCTLLKASSRRTRISGRHP